MTITHEFCTGYEDMGPGFGDSSREAKEVLVLMAVGMREHWKVPISFHLTRGANAKDIHYFQYRDREIYVTLDDCHMLKVLRYEVYCSLSKSASNHLTLHLTMLHCAYSEPKLYLQNFVI